MEPVSAEFVEQSADFFFRLTDAQLKERVMEFKKKQPNIYIRLTSKAVGLNAPVKMDFVWRLNLLFTHCYETYIDKLPMITETAFEVLMKEVMKKGKAWEKESIHDSFADMMDRGINQPHIVDYMKTKVESVVKKGDTITKVEGIKIHNLLILNGHMFEKAIKRR